MIATRTTDEEFDRYAKEIRERIALERQAKEEQAGSLLKKIQQMRTRREKS